MDIFMGFIAAFGFNYPPRDWVWCAGQLLAISDNTSLYSLLGSLYGGDDRSVYGIPELRGRVPMGYGQSPGLPNYPLGLRYGTPTHTLTLSQMPAHNHDAVVAGGGVSVSGAIYASVENGANEQPQIGDYLATSFKVRGDLNKNYIPDADKGTTVPLNGLEVEATFIRPTVVTDDAGNDRAFEIMQPITAINYSMVFQGLYPPRN